MKDLQEIYQKLLTIHGPQGWWPINGHYHKNKFYYPRSNLERFEICVGAILTQNTTWKNVDLALLNLRSMKLLHPRKLLISQDQLIKEAIHPAGYFNQKTKKLKIFTEFYINLKGHPPKRSELLKLWGIGPETADCMLLYAFDSLHFVVDSYTKRIFLHLGIIKQDWDYHKIQHKIEKNIPPQKEIFQEFHALIVEHAKKYYSKKPYGQNCPLKTKVK